MGETLEYAKKAETLQREKDNMYQYENIISEVKRDGTKGRYACTQDAQEVWRKE